MGSEWPIYKLKDLTTKIGSGATPTGGKDAYKAEGIPLFRSQNVYNLTFDPSGLAFIDEDQAAKLDSVAVAGGDILLNITGDSVARCCKAPENFLPARVNQHVAIIRIKPNLIEENYLIYHLVSPKVQGEMLGIAGGGATRNTLTKAIIEEFDIPLPPLPTQRQIAAILSAFDDKIELNRRMNRTLEQMARALFKSWFVDFDPVRAKMRGELPEGMDAETAALFPDELEEVEGREVPRGWQVGVLGKFYAQGIGGVWGEDSPKAASDKLASCLRGIDIHELAERVLPEPPLRYIPEKALLKRSLRGGEILIEGSGSFCGRSLIFLENQRDVLGETIAYSNFVKRLEPLDLSLSQQVIIYAV